MSIRFKKNNSILVHTKGMTQEQVADAFRLRISKRQKEIDKRKWIYDEYLKLISLQENDEMWLRWVLRQDSESWSTDIL